MMLRTLLFRALTAGIVGLTVGIGAQPVQAAQLPPGFVYLRDVDPSIEQDMRYTTAHNFTGAIVPGYVRPACILTTQAATALAAAQKVLTTEGLSLSVYDCYRPQKAVDAFETWAANPDTRMAAEFYPTEPKAKIIPDGYVATKSGHSRGSTFDVTIVRKGHAPEPAYVPGEPLASCTLPQAQRFPDPSLDFGTGYDCFNALAHTDNPAVTPQQHALRMKLRDLLAAHGFVNLPEEWWHFTLKNEPFPNSYFNFDIR